MRIPVVQVNNSEAGPSPIDLQSSTPLKVPFNCLKMLIHRVGPQRGREGVLYVLDTEQQRRTPDKGTL